MELTCNISHVHKFLSLTQRVSFKIHKKVVLHKSLLSRQMMFHPMRLWNNNRLRTTCKYCLHSLKEARRKVQKLNKLFIRGSQAARHHHHLLLTSICSHTLNRSQKGPNPKNQWEADVQTDADPNFLSEKQSLQSMLKITWSPLCPQWRSPAPDFQSTQEPPPTTVRSKQERKPWPAWWTKSKTTRIL